MIFLVEKSSKGPAIWGPVVRRSTPNENDGSCHRRHLRALLENEDRGGAWNNGTWQRTNPFLVSMLQGHGRFVACILFDIGSERVYNTLRETARKSATGDWLLASTLRLSLGRTKVDFRLLLESMFPQTTVSKAKYANKLELLSYTMYIKGYIPCFDNILLVVAVREPVKMEDWVR